MTSDLSLLRGVKARIVTVFEYPPIPVRLFDWRAYRDPEGKQGFGSTEREAIQDLIDQEEDDA